MNADERADQKWFDPRASAFIRGRGVFPLLDTATGLP
jgi:hypothetical protein